MAIKSTNTQGNPYHDESNGQFTSENGSSAKKVEGERKPLSLRFKSNFDINAARADLQRVGHPSQTTQPISPVGTFKEASSIEEANAIGKSILPGCVVNYSNDCDVGKANDMNRALADISNRFPGFVANGLLNAYGDGVSLSLDEIRNIAIQSAINVIKNDKYFSGVYEEFFNMSKQRFGTKEEDKYSERILSYFMGFDPHFDMKNYAYAKSGDALAYYQVSHDRLTNVGMGGKGINGAIKFYTNIMGTPTQREINESRNAIASGFHFDYGEHSYTYGTGVHELGHSIFTIAFKKCNDEERAELVQLLEDGKRKDYHQVSGYGHYTNYEQEAEAVADVMCRGNNATPHNKKMVAWLDKVHARLKANGEV